MGNRATPSRTFNTVKHSNREKRMKRHQQERIVLYSICTVVIAILLTLAIFLGCFIVAKIKASQPDDPYNNSNTPPAGTQPITYMALTQATGAVNSGILQIVNGENEYQFPTTPSLKGIYDNRVKYDGVSNTYMVNGNNASWKLHTEALDALNQMMLKHYELFEDGSVTVTSAYRSFEDQQAIKGSVKAGYSDHHTGFCVALKKDGNKDLESDHWIYGNCYKYGFIVRYPDVKKDQTGVSGYEYCFRYVGVAHATYIYNNNLCLEEYVELLRSTYNASNHLKITGADGNAYEVYYVPAGTTEITTMQVPKNYQYTISGDNMNGFIITVNLNAPINE